MSNGDDPIIVCCLTGVCCPPGSAKQQATMLKFVRHERPTLTLAQAQAKAAAILAHHENFSAVARILNEPV